MQIIIDRFEGDFAIVEMPDLRLVNAPKALFPGAMEGDIYNISNNADETAARKKRIQEKFDELKKD